MATIIDQQHKKISIGELAAMLVVAASMLVLTALGGWSIGWMEVAGFITGGICVWLTVRENIWTWPIGIANNIVFFALFWHARLFADATLQILYLILGAYGWWYWLNGGEEQKPQLPITRTTAMEWGALVVFLPCTTWLMMQLLIFFNGSAPFWDALTTSISLVAQLLLCRKRLENWLFWIAADIIYIPLYIARGLPLTAGLYFVFLLMCVVGIAQWWHHWRFRDERVGAIA